MNADERRAIEHECARLIALYANLNDAAAWESVVELFAPDGRLARPTAPDDWLRGHEAILAAFRARPARATRHVCANVVIEVDDPQHARGESAMALYLSDATAKVGSFHDAFVLTPAGWRFAERRGSLTF